ncbi:PA2169 family four-helix-bundle protein [Ramlibacter sp. AN1015]|uniref:ferritin-like domain-containing protein n=1 Tax=Ramlibacter sp. AN1015 TaxID=3133428 RepID=UPI0030C22096
MAEDKDLNRDPLSDEPGSHPVGTGVGAAGGALAGAAAGVIGGPAGMAVGGVVGALVGGLAGRAAAEAVNPTEEEDYWRENYSREPYYASGRSFDDYGPAYRHGLHARQRYDDWDTAEPYLASEWENTRGGSSLSWKDAQPASRAAWDRVDPHYRGNTGGFSGAGSISGTASGAAAGTDGRLMGAPIGGNVGADMGTRASDPGAPDGNLHHYGTGMASTDSSLRTGGPGVGDTHERSADHRGDADRDLDRDRLRRDETTHMQSSGMGSSNVGSGSMGWDSMGATSTMTGGTLGASAGMDASYTAGTTTGHDMGTASGAASGMGSPGAQADRRVAAAHSDDASRSTSSAGGTGTSGIGATIGSAQQAGKDSGDREDTIKVLNDLIETCKDGEYGFQQCADHASREDLKSIFRQRVEDCRRGASQLQEQVRSLGGRPDDDGSAMGSVARGWTATRAALSSNDDKAVLEEAERSEDNALARYRKALQKPLPDHIRQIVQHQLDGVQRNHDQIKRLRDQLRAAG